MHRHLHRHSRSVALYALLATCLSLSPGCTCGYASSVVAGQLALLGNLQPVQQALAGDQLTSRQKDRIRFVLAAREYAINGVGLNVGQTYTQFYDTAGGVLAYNVSACPADRFAPLTWSFPLAGTYEYLGFFSADQADRFQKALTAAGYDTFQYEVDAYSTVGLIPDPIYSTMLNRDDVGLAEVVFHELTHNTVFRPDDTEFNESVATFVGRTAAQRFLADRFGADAEIVAQAQQRFADEDLFTEFIDGLYQELADYYRTDRPLQETLAGREQIIDRARQQFAADYLPLLFQPQLYSGVLTANINNALILGYRRYHRGLDVFQQVYDALDGRFSSLLAVLTQASQSSDPYSFLRRWVADH